MIEVERLTKYYGRLAAIKDVSFRINSGEIVGFLGPNGAGKTTTIRILTCFSPASAGRARILGMDSATDSLQIRQKIGYLPENVPLYSWMRVKHFLGFVARAKGIASSDRSKEINRVMSAVGIDGVKDRIIKTLSKGYRQRVGLAQALVGDPPILILDEPTIGLDPKQIREIRKLIRGFAEDRTVILSTHILPEVSQTCSRVIIVNKGSIVAEDTPENLTRGHTKSTRCKVVVRAPEQEVASLVSGMAGVLAVRSAEESDGNEAQLLVECSPEMDVRAALSRTLVEKGWDLLELRPIDVSLEDVFIDLVTEENQEELATNDSVGTEVAK